MSRAVITPTEAIAKSGLLAEKKRQEIEQNNRHLGRPALEDVCNDPYCMKCPPSSCTKDEESQEKNRETPIQVNAEPKDEVLNNPFKKAAKWIRQMFSYICYLKVLYPHNDRHRQLQRKWNQIFLLSCLLATFLDPLFFFLLSVQRENKCVSFNWNWAWAIGAFRTLTDVIALRHILYQCRRAYFDAGKLVVQPKKIAMNYLGSKGFWIDFLVVMPLPQIMFLSHHLHFLFTGPNQTKTILKSVVLFQFLLRLYRFLPLLIGQSANAFTFETAWAHFFLNLLSFVLAGHIIGSTWYLFGLQRVNECLRMACHKSLMGLPCTRLIDCGSRIPDPGYHALWNDNTLANSCFEKDAFPYGIYSQAVNLTQHGALSRYMYSLFWGFQQISTLAGNQIPSYFVGEILFTMIITGFGLLLFALLIGNIQNFLQSPCQRRLERMQREQDVDRWMRLHHLSDELRRRVRAAERNDWETTRGFDEDQLMGNLPKALQADIRQEFYSEFFSKVKVFSGIDQRVLDAIFERIGRKTYPKGSCILFPSGSISVMTFIVDGEMRSTSVDGREYPLVEPEFCGEELLELCLVDSSPSRATLGRITRWRPISKRTVTCITNVKAFTLKASDLEEVASLFTDFIRQPLVQDAIRSELQKSRSRAGDIQAAPQSQP